MKKLKRYVLLGLFLAIPNAHAIFGDNLMALKQMKQFAQIIQDNAHRYQQLNAIIKTSQENEEYLRNLNAGVENIILLVESLPLRDKNILHQMKDFRTAYNSLLEVYGKIPKGKDEIMYRLHDETVAESVAMVGHIYKYASGQEKNAVWTASQARQASLKGAAQMNAHTNSQILHTLNQLLKVNGQMLKLQSESLAMANKREKDSTKSRQHIDQDMAMGFKNLSMTNKDFKIPRFD